MITHRNIEANGINIHVAEAGDGPLVLLLHGFPELWYSYRHQLLALAEAGYHAVAPDMRGYGRTDSPADISQYAMPRLAGDVIGIVNALGGERFVVVGHDWGSPVASNVALFRPDLVRGVVLLSVPYLPRGDADVLTMLIGALGPDNYQVFFQEPGVAEKAFEADVKASVISYLIGCSGDVPEINLMDKVDPAQPWGDYTSQALPAWLTEEDIDYYTSEFRRTRGLICSRTGFHGANRPRQYADRGCVLGWVSRGEDWAVIGASEAWWPTGEDVGRRHRSGWLAAQGAQM